MLAYLIAAAAASTSPTLQATPRRLDNGGVRATYTRSVGADGKVHLKGFYDEGRAPFHYRIAGDRVDGSVDGLRVTFRLPAASGR